MIGDVLVRIGADISDYRRNLKTAGNDLQNFGNKMESTGTSIATTFGAIAVASAAGIGIAVKAASDYESAFAGVRKVLDASEKDFQDLSRAIQDMSKEIPASAEEIASVAEISGQLGIAKDDLMAFTRTMIDLGISTNMSAEEAATALARLANITGMSMDNIDRLGSTVVDLGNNLATTESEIVEMGLRLAGAGNQIGLTEAQILSFAGALSSVGIEAEAGGTAFSRVFLNMNTAVMDGGKELEKFAKVAGMSSSDFAKAFEDDAATALMTFISGLDTLSQEGANTAAVLADLGLGEIRVRDALMRAAGASGVFSDALQIGNKAWDENNALTYEASQRYKTFASKLEMLKNRLKNVMAIIGVPFMNALLGMAEALEPVISGIEKMAEKFSNSSKGFQQFVAVGAIVLTLLAALGAGIGLLLIFVGSAVTAFGAIASAVGMTSLALLKIVGIVAGVVGAVTAIIAIVIWAYNEFESFRNLVNAVWEAIKNAVQVAFEFISNIIQTVVSEVVSFAQEQLAKFKDLWDKHGASIMALVKGYFTHVKVIISGVMNVIKGIFQTVWPIISNTVKVAWELIKTVIGSAIDIVVGIIDVGMSLLKGDWEGAWNSIKNTAKNIVDNIVRFFKNVDLFEIGKNIIKGLVDGIASMKDAAINTVKKVGKNIKDTLTSFFGIKSPSRVMRDEIGKMIGAGLIIGMESELSGIAKMAQRVSEAATPEQPKLAGFEVGDFRGHAQKVSAELSANASEGTASVTSNDTYNFRGMLEGSTFIVREEADIDRIAEQLAQKVRETKARKGIR